MLSNFQIFAVLVTLVISISSEPGNGEEKNATTPIKKVGNATMPQKKQYVTDQLRQPAAPISPMENMAPMAPIGPMPPNPPPVPPPVPNGSPALFYELDTGDLTATDAIMQINQKADLQDNRHPLYDTNTEHPLYTINDGRTEELFEGDIVKTPHLEEAVAEMKRMQHHGLKGYDAINGGQWPNAIVPYRFAYGFRGQSVVHRAIAAYKQHTCIKFRPAKSRDRNYVEFMHGGGCSSMIGRQGGRQQISLASGCLVTGIAIHEMMHALGFFHEQSRRDRDNYITINWNNMNRRMGYNFQKYRSGHASTLGEPYDKKSVMHYGNYAFSINGRKTIVSKANSNEVLGQRSGLSPIDIRQLNTYYKCDNTGPNPKPPTGGKKKDKYPFCPDLSKWCTKNTFVRSICEATCCRDLNKNCSRWKRARYCKGRGYDTWMKQNCPRSCGFC